MMERSKNNPLITAKDIQPSSPDLKVVGVFNCGAALFKGEPMLLLRIAESALPKDDLTVSIPLIKNNKLHIQHLEKNNADYDFSDTRVVKNKHKKVAYLTVLSHFRRAYKREGRWIIDEKPRIFPEGKMEAWGIEDPRITHIEDTYYITYTAASPYGTAVGLIETRDFECFKRRGLILPANNKDAVLFPEKINGKYRLYHRPIPADIGTFNIWAAASDDLISWGEHEVLLEPAKSGWESGRLGAGAPPVKTEKGWLHIYHAATWDDVYCLGAFLTELDNPQRIIAKTPKPILSPETDYEKSGFFGGVVFSCGVILQDEVLDIYYGAADDKICSVSVPLGTIFGAMESYNS